MSSFSQKKPRNINEAFRVLFFLTPFIFLLFLAFLQVLNLTLIKGEDFKTQADSNRIYQSKIYPKRGFIYDKNNILLAENVIQQDLKITLEYVEEIDFILLKISKLLNIDYEQLESDFYLRSSKKNPLPARTSDVGGKQKVSSGSEISIHQLEKQLKYLKARKEILAQIKGLESQVNLFKKKLEILKLEFETGN